MVNTTERNKESLNKTENDKSVLLNKFLREFGNYYFPEGQSETTDRLKELFEGNTSTSVIPPSIVTQLEMFRANNQKTYGSVELGDINVFNLRNVVVNKYLLLKKARENLKKIVESEYTDLEDSKKSKLETLINDLDIEEINGLQRSTDARKKFLLAKKILSKDKETRNKRIEEFFASRNILEGYETFSTEKKEAIQELFTNDGKLKPIDSTVAMLLFETNIFTTEEKIKLAKLFFPTISVRELRRFEIFGVPKTDEIINEVLDGLVDSIPGVNPADKQNIKNSINEGDLELSLEDLINSNTLYLQEKKLSEFISENNVYLKDFAEAYNQGLGDILNSDSSKKFPKGLESFKEQLNSTQKVENLGAFESGNYIVLETLPESSSETSEATVPTKGFFKIVYDDNGDFSFQLVNIGIGEIDFSKINRAGEKSYFGKFLDIINNGRPGFKVKKCSFETEKTIREKISKGEIKDIGTTKKSEKWQEIEDKKQGNLNEYRKLREELFEKALDLSGGNPSLSSLITEAKTANSELLQAKEDLEKVKKEVEVHSKLALSDFATDNIKTELVALRKKKEALEGKILDLERDRNEKVNKFFDDLENLDNVDFLQEDEKELLEKIKKIKRDLDVNADNLGDLELEEATLLYLTEDEVKNLLDEEDPEGKDYKFGEGLSFVTDKGKWSVFTIKSIDKSKGGLKVVNGEGYEDFFYFDVFVKTFKQEGCKRLSASKDFEGLVNNVSLGKNVDTGTARVWSKFEFSYGKIIDKDVSGEKKKKLKYKYLVASDGIGDTNLIKIESISGDRVTISLGEYNKYKKDKKGDFEKDKYGKKIEQGTYGVSSGRYVVSTSWLETWIKSNKAVPRNFEAENVKRKEDVKGANRHFSLFSMIGSWMSIADIIAGGKLGIESIEARLKEGSEEKAAKFAQGTFGKVLPESLKDDLLTRVEEAQKKRADAYVTKLGNVDSWKATKMIEGWLLKKNSPQYMIEAGLIYMFQKYGVLYAKRGLYKHKGTFLWYTALGGKVGDELYCKIKEEMEGNNLNFTEEELVYKLLVEQGQAGGYNGIRRRTRLHKDVKNFRSNGKKEDYGKGKEDATGERTVAGRIRMALGELTGGTYPNMRGVLEQVVNKGGSMTEMNEIPFLLTFSGAAYNCEQDELDALKNFPASSMLLPMLRMISLRSDIDLMNETILEVCRRLSEIEDKPAIYKEAKKIFENSKKVPPAENYKIVETQKFYAEYGEKLTNILYMLNTGKPGNALNKMIFIEKDDWKDKNGDKREGNTTFKKYYDLLNDVYIGEASWASDDLLSDAFAQKGTSGMTYKGMVKATKSVLQLRQGGGFNMSKSSSFMLKEISNEIRAIRESKGEYGIYGNEERKKALKNILKGFASGILGTHASQTVILDQAFGSEKSPFRMIYKAAGISDNMLKMRNYTFDAVDGGEVDGIFDEYVEESLKPLGTVADKVADSVRDAVNDSIFEKAA